MRAPDHREASYGHGVLDLMNATHARWQWHRNQDSEPVVSDEVRKSPGPGVQHFLHMRMHACVCSPYAFVCVLLLAGCVPVAQSSSVQVA